jgi:hypothetical protein
MIPPLIKRLRILVSSGVIIVISVKLYVIKSVAAKRVAATFVAARTLPENSRFPISSDQRKCFCRVELPRLFTSGFSLHTVAPETGSPKHTLIK